MPIAYQNVSGTPGVPGFSVPRGRMNPSTGQTARLGTRQVTQGRRSTLSLPIGPAGGRAAVGITAITGANDY